MDTLDWLLTALQNEHEDVASHALLLLWKRVTQDDAQGLSMQACADMGPRPWRRLGLLLFADDPLTVRAVLGIASALTTSGREELRQRALCRVWQSEWRQFVIDKLTDCHARASTALSSRVQAKSSGNHDLEVATRLLVVLQAVFLHALEMKQATVKDQVRMVDLLVELVMSPLDTVACVSVEFLSTLIGVLNTMNGLPTLGLDPDVAAYLESSRVFVDLLHWVHGTMQTTPDQRLQAAGHRTSQQPSRLSMRRCQLTLALLVVGARRSQLIAVALAQNPALLMKICLGCVEAPQLALVDNKRLIAVAVELLDAVVTHDSPQASEMVSHLRLSGGLITLSWLQSHCSSAVRQTVDRIFSSTIRLSPASDLVRVLVEQGCVVVSYLCLHETTGASIILQWLVHELENSGTQLVQTIAEAVLPSTNHKLQRNVILSLLLLSQSSNVVHEALSERISHEEETFFDGIVHAAVTASDDTSLATSLLAVAVIFTDKRSTLRLDAAAKVTLRSTLSLRDVTAETVAPPSGIVEFVCADSAVVTADAALVAQHCKVIQRQFESLAYSALPRMNPDSVVVDLREFQATAVELFVRVLSLATYQLGSSPHPYNKSDVEKLIILAHRLECAKCWHAATFATTQGLQSGVLRWKEVFDLAVNHRHPALMLRAVRVALGETNARNHKEIYDTMLTVWRELIEQD